MSLPRLLRLAPRAPLRPLIRTYASGADINSPAQNLGNPRPVIDTPRGSYQGRNGSNGGDAVIKLEDDVETLDTAALLKMEQDDYDMSMRDDDDDFGSFEFDDFTSIGHSNLDLHREARQYARLAAYEMPMLAKLRTEFVPPTEKQVLRFRYTTYMGEQHPAEKKVVVEAHVEDLLSDEKERLKFMKLAGSRVDHRGVLKMSCERFEEQAQNKRYLADMVDKLIKEAKDKSDMFEDIPLDTRHIKASKKNPKPSFPESWKLTPQRRAQLEAERAEKERLYNAQMLAIREAENAAIAQAQAAALAAQTGASAAQAVQQQAQAVRRMV